MKQSTARPCRTIDDRHKGRDVFTSAIVPARDIAPPVGGIPVLSSSVSPWAAHVAGVAGAGFVQQNSVPSAHMRCMMMAIRRATATIARFIPRCRATFMPQAFNHDHFLVRVSMLWAASYSTVRIMESPHFEMPPIRSISPD